MAKATALSIAKNVEDFTDDLSRKTDRWWLVFLMLIGLVVLGVMLYWHREDQKQMTELTTSTIRANTEALARVASAMERMERRAP